LDEVVALYVADKVQIVILKIRAYKV